jgi:hypothetical protein
MRVAKPLDAVGDEAELSNKSSMMDCQEPPFKRRRRRPADLEPATDGGGRFVERDGKRLTAAISLL